MSETARRENEENIEVTEDLTEKNLSYIERMDKFKESIDSIDYFYLYKYESDRSNEHTFIDKYDPNYPPDEHEIGLKHGGGKYLIRLVVKKCTQFPKGTTRIYLLKIHKRYDELKEKREKKESVEIREREPVQVSQPNEKTTSNSTMEIITVVEKIVSLISPLIIPLLTKKDEKKDATANAMAQIMKESYSQMGTMMRSTIEENYKMITELQRKNYENVETTFKNRNKSPESEESIVDKILPLISEYLPKILGNNVEAKLLQTGIKASDEFKALQNDKQQMEQLIYYILQQEGVEKTTKLLDALGINYQFAQPEQVTQPIQPEREIYQDEPESEDPPFEPDEKPIINKKKGVKRKMKPK